MVPRGSKKYYEVLRVVLRDTTRYNEVPNIRDIPEAYSEPCQSSKIERLRK